MFRDATILFHDIETSVNSDLVTSSSPRGKAYFCNFEFYRMILLPPQTFKILQKFCSEIVFCSNEAVSQIKKFKTVKAHDLFLTKKVADA